MDTKTAGVAHQTCILAVINITTELILEVNREVEALECEAGTKTAIYVGHHVANQIVVSIAVAVGLLFTHLLTTLLAYVALHFVLRDDLPVLVVVDFVCDCNLIAIGICFPHGVAGGVDVLCGLIFIHPPLRLTGF